MDEYERFMRVAMVEAGKAKEKQEVPIGAVIVRNGKVIARGHNKKNRGNNALLHAEMIAINKAIEKLGDWRLTDCDLYVTLEPCPMCAGACINARVRSVIFGAYDPKAGCCGTLYNLPEDTRFNHRPKVVGGILEDECGKILSDFFKSLRKNKE
ncbi:MAG: tRNA adenosine(34) deaminase TadA [Clostridia bacterium]|nr:tRNA adenosine(34) deaminase TadA [Clostridia bacterium]